MNPMNPHRKFVLLRSYDLCSVCREFTGGAFEVPFGKILDAERAGVVDPIADPFTTTYHFSGLYPRMASALENRDLKNRSCNCARKLRNASEDFAKWIERQ